MSTVYFIGDLHLGHRNIAKFREGFVDSIQHDEFLKEQIRKCYGKRNSLWLLGDTVFHLAHEEFMEELCKNFLHVHNVLGNHCTETSMREGIQRRLYGKYDNFHLHGIIKKYGFWISHAPIHPDELRDKFNIHGHVHSETLPDKRYLNISAENINYKPKTLEQIRSYFNV